jgi:curli biogenesis system outer membrane secretion channel CsgG
MTTKLLLIAALSLAPVGAQTAKQATPASAAKPAAANQLPAGAEKVSEGVYRHKDSAGKAWIYTRTPFGFAKGEEGAAPAAPVPSAIEFRVVEVKGDTVRFERDSPFGKSVWTRRIADLDEKEKAAYESRKSDAPKPRQ